jgi:hypothetical protein
MHATQTHNVGYGSTSNTGFGNTGFHNQGKMRIISLAKGGDAEENWRGKLYQQFQLHGTQYFTEMELNKFPFDYRDIMNCLCKFRRKNVHLVKECESFGDTDFEYKQSEIDEDDDSKNLWEEVDYTFSIMADEEYFVMYIPSFNIMMYRVGKKCDFFAMNREELGAEEVECKIRNNFVVKQHIEDTEKKCESDGKQFVPVIGFYIR